MTSFDQYFLMNSEEVKEYVKKKVSFMLESRHLEANEIGDGNLNYVFRVINQETGKSVIIKQAGPTARFNDDFKLSTDRIRIESKALQIEGLYTPNFVPEIYFYDDVMSCCAMEDLSDFTIMRTALIKNKTFPLFADHISTFMAESLLRSSDVVLNHKEKKFRVGEFINPELCEVSEDLVFTEPYFNSFNRNEVMEENHSFVNEHLYKNETLHFEVAKLKYLFLTKAETLLHGDLHTGSIFIKENETKIIDPEFAFYGPMGYDVGNVVANLVFAWMNGEAKDNESFKLWVEETIIRTIDLFKEKFTSIWNQSAAERFAQNQAFQQHYLSTVISESAGMAGLEMNRRIVGLAKVKDITSLEKEKRIQVERLCIVTANRFILQREQIQNGNDFVQVLKEVKETLI